MVAEAYEILEVQGAGQCSLWSRILERKVPGVVMRILHVMCHGWSCETWKKLFTSFWDMLSSQNIMFLILNVLKLSTPNCDSTILSLVRIVDYVNVCALHLHSSTSFIRVKLRGSGFGIENSSKPSERFDVITAERILCECWKCISFCNFIECGKDYLRAHRLNSLQRSCREWKELEFAVDASSVEFQLFLKPCCNFSNLIFNMHFITIIIKCEC
jgi:hypothetical protein